MVQQIESTLGYTFKDSALLQRALVHSSYLNENPNFHLGHNERLEFLGDAVLGLLVSQALYSLFPNIDEGELSRLRSNAVNAIACQRYLDTLGLSNLVLLGKGEALNLASGRSRSSIVANVFEALLGALYLDGGLEACRALFSGPLKEPFVELVENPEANYKALLQEYCQKTFKEPPQYELLSTSGPDHEREFEIAVLIAGNLAGRGRGPSKKIAQQHAACDALKGVS